MRKIAVVIVTYNNALMLRDLLEDVFAQSHKADEVIVIDNASADATQETVKAFLPSVRYVRNEYNTGSAGGFYEGIRLAAESNDAVWLLDDDVSLKPDALQQLVLQLEILERASKVGAVRSWCADKCSFAAPRKTNSFAWRGTLITKEAIEAAGLPRQDYFLYGDDAEYALRLVRKAFSIFWIPSSRVIEKSRPSGSMERSRLYYAFRNQVHVEFTYHQWWALILTLLYSVKVMGKLLFCRCAGRKDSMQAVKDGIKDGFSARLGRNQAYIL